MAKAEGLLALLAKPSGEEAGESEDAARDILDAIKDDDAKALNLALKRHYEVCETEHDEED